MLIKLIRQIQHKARQSRFHGIAFMPLDEALALALASPHWQQIGRGKGKYHFCRRDHSIGYTAENTFIGSAEDNSRESITRCKPQPKIYASAKERNAAKMRRRYHRRNPNAKYIKSKYAASNPEAAQ